MLRMLSGLVSCLLRVYREGIGDRGRELYRNGPLAILIFALGCGGGVVDLTSAPGPDPVPGGNTRLKILVTQPGVYKVTYEAMRTAGFDPSGVAPKDLGLKHFIDGQWSEVPLSVFGADDGQMNSGDYVEFYGIPIQRGDRRFEFSDTDVYWLVSEAGDHRRIGMKPALTGLTSVDQTVFPVTTRIEEDTHYWQNMPDDTPEDGQRPDRWMWGTYLSRRLSTDASSSQPTSDYSRDVLFSIDNYSSKYPVTLTFHLQSRTSATANPAIGSDGHRVKVYLNFEKNSNLVASEVWDGLTAFEFTATVSAPQGLVDGLNSLRIINASNSDLSQFYLDWLEVNYHDGLRTDDGVQLDFQGDAVAGDTTPRLFLLKDFTERPDVFDVTDFPAQVARIGTDAALLGYQFKDAPGSTARAYVAVSNLGKLSPEEMLSKGPETLHAITGGDYLVITHENFYDAIQPLVQYRTTKGLKVVTAKMTDVYDEFSGGVVDPLAIKAFLTYAYQNWNPRPRYVLLVGDATYDYKDHLLYGAQYGVKSYVPTYLYEFAGLGEVPSDNWFADVVTEDMNQDGIDDGLPDVAIGRIPAKFATDVTTVVNKIRDYEAGGHAGTHALYIAEDPYETISLNLVVDFFPEDPNLVHVLNRVDWSLDSQGLVAVRKKLLSELDSSPWLVNYIGHGSVVDWGREELFRSRSMKDLNGLDIPGIDNLTPGENYFALVTLNCLNGNFALPDEGVVDPLTGISIPPSMAESFLLTRNKGAIGVWADSAYGFQSEYGILGRKFYTALLVDRKTLGDATRTAIWEGWVNPGQDNLAQPLRPIPKDLISTIVLFGDPATIIQAP